MRPCSLQAGVSAVSMADGCKNRVCIPWGGSLAHSHGRTGHCTAGTGTGCRASGQLCVSDGVLTSARCGRGRVVIFAQQVGFAVLGVRAYYDFHTARRAQFKRAELLALRWPACGCLFGRAAAALCSTALLPTSPCRRAAPAPAVWERARQERAQHPAAQHRRQAHLRRLLLGARLCVRVRRLQGGPHRVRPPAPLTRCLRDLGGRGRQRAPAFREPRGRRERRAVRGVKQA